MRIAKVPLSVFDGETYGTAFTLGFLSKSGSYSAVEFYGFQSNQSGLKGLQSVRSTPFAILPVLRVLAFLKGLQFFRVMSYSFMP